MFTTPFRQTSKINSSFSLAKALSIIIIIDTLLLRRDGKSYPLRGVKTILMELVRSETKSTGFAILETRQRTSSMYCTILVPLSPRKTHHASK